MNHHFLYPANNIFDFLPFGEEMAVQHSQTADFETRYKFNDYGGKKIKYLFVERIQRSCELDQETGLYYYGARYYNPQTSIWLSVDPLVEKYPGINPYNYVMNNPINHIDPFGLYCVDADGKNIPCSDKFSKYKGPTRHTAILDNGEKIGEVDYDENYGGQLDEVDITVTSHNKTNSSRINSKIAINSLKFSNELINEEKMLLNNNYGDRYSINFSSGVTETIKGNTLVTTNIKLDVNNSLASYGCSLGSENFSTGVYVDTKNSGLGASVTLFGVTHSNSFTAKGISTSLTYTNDNKYATVGFSGRPGLLTAGLVVAVATGQLEFLPAGLTRTIPLIVK